MSAEEEVQEALNDGGDSLFKVQAIANFILGSKFKLEKVLRHDNHAVVFSVTSIPPDETPLEARIYNLEGISKKLRQYRLRNLKRLSSRSVFEDSWPGKAIIVYKADGQSIEEQEASMPSKFLQLQEKSDVIVVDPKVPQKTDHQREMKRIRQLERRKSHRRKERQLKRGEKPERGSIDGDEEGIFPEQDINEEGIYPEQDINDDETLFVLDMAYDQPQFRKLLPPASLNVLERYLQNQDINFADEDEMEAFMTIRHYEMLFLHEQHEKVRDKLKRVHDKFERVQRDLAQFPQLSRENREMQGSVILTEHCLKLTRNFCDITEMIQEAEKSHRGLQKRLSLIRQMMEVC